MTNDFAENAIHQVLWPDADFESIAIGFEDVTIELRESTGRQGVFRCGGHIGFELVGFWGEMIIESAEISMTDPFIEECWNSIAERYRRPPPESGLPARDCDPEWMLFQIRFIDTSVLRVVASEFSWRPRE